MPRARRLVVVFEDGQTSEVRLGGSLHEALADRSAGVLVDAIVSAARRPTKVPALDPATLEAVASWLTSSSTRLGTETDPALDDAVTIAEMIAALLRSGELGGQPPVLRIRDELREVIDALELRQSLFAGEGSSIVRRAIDQLRSLLPRVDEPLDESVAEANVARTLDLFNAARATLEEARSLAVSNAIELARLVR